MINKRLFAINLAYVLTVVNVNSAEYRFVPGISLSTVYIDNVLLQQEGFEQSDIVYEASPQFLFTMDGGRTDVSASYKMQVLEYDSSDGDTVNHQLNAKTNVEIYKNNLFLDANVTRNQTYIDYNKPVAPGPYTRTDNRTDVTTYRATPIFQTRLWDGASVEARKTYSRLEYDVQETNELEREDTSIVVKSVISGGDITLGLNYKNSKDRSTNFDSTQEYLSIHYDITPRILIFGEIGKEHNNRETSLAKADADYYRSGISWKPNDRSKIDAAYGERALGKTSSVDAVFASRTKSIGLTYSKEITSTIDIYARQSDAGTPAQGTDLSLPALDERLFLSEKYQVYFTRNFSKTTLSLKYYEEQRSFEDGGLVERIDGHNLGWSWYATARTSFIFAYSGSTIKDERTNLEDTIDTITLGVMRTIGSSGNASFFYSDSSQKFEDGLVSYETQTAILSLFLSF